MLVAGEPWVPYVLTELTWSGMPSLPADRHGHVIGHFHSLVAGRWFALSRAVLEVAD